MAVKKKKPESNYIKIAIVLSIILLAASIWLYSKQLITPNIFIVIATIISVAGTFGIVFPIFRKNVRTSKIAFIASLFSLIFLVSGVLLGFYRGKIVFDQEVTPNLQEAYTFSATGPLTIEIMGDFEDQEKKAEQVDYELLLKSGDYEQKLSGHFGKEWIKIRKGRRRASSFGENTFGIFEAKHKSDSKEWELFAQKIPAEIRGRLNVKIHEEIVPPWIVMSVEFLLLLLIVYLEHRVVKAGVLARKLIGNPQEEFPPASWFAASCYCFGFLYQAAANGIFIERAFIPAIPGAIIGGVAIAWLLQHYLYKNLDPSKK